MPFLFEEKKSSSTKLTSFEINIKTINRRIFAKYMKPP